MKAVILLCTQKNISDSKEFVNAEITKANVMIEGNPNSVHSQGLTRSDVYDEARQTHQRYV